MFIASPEVLTFIVFMLIIIKLTNHNDKKENHHV